MHIIQWRHAHPELAARLIHPQIIKLSHLIVAARLLQLFVKLRGTDKPFERKASYLHAEQIKHLLVGGDNNTLIIEQGRCIVKQAR